MNSRTSIALIALSLIIGSASAQSTQAVEWKVSEGGNGHWYRLDSTQRSWSASQSQAELVGGHLVTIASAGEQTFVEGLPGLDEEGCAGPAIGLQQDSEGVEPGGGWRWITGEPLDYLMWGTIGGEQNPDDSVGDVPNGTVDRAALWCPPWHDWDDVPDSDEYLIASIIEWDADCNGDGIVDYGQIQRGEFADLNGNGVPDVCEVSVSGVTPPSVPSQGGSTITIRGTNFQGTPSVKIGGVPATNVVTVSPISLTATSPALLPGMVSVTVNGFTLPDGIYIRPQCGSDLDQDGEVTASDIAIVLLDFGPCHSNAAHTQPQYSTPFLLKEQPAAATPQTR